MFQLLFQGCFYGKARTGKGDYPAGFAAGGDIQGNERTLAVSEEDVFPVRVFPPQQVIPLFRVVNDVGKAEVFLFQVRHLALSRTPFVEPEGGDSLFGEKVCQPKETVVFTPQQMGVAVPVGRPGARR